MSGAAGGQTREGLRGGILLLGEPETFLLNPNPLPLQSQQDSWVQVSDALKGWFPRLSPLPFGTAPPVALYANFHTFDLN